MLTCKQMTEMATDRAEGILGAPERERFDRHLVGCNGCRAYVRQLDLIRQALGRLPEPEISPVLENALMAQFDRMAPARFAPWPVAGTLGALGLLVAFSRNR